MEPTTSTDDYETHITVRLTDTARLSALQEWARNQGLKCIHILLDRGATVSQPMLTRHGRGTLGGELAGATALSEALGVVGFCVTRVKIEAAPSNALVPQKAAEAAAHPPGRYFEHHIKLLLEPEADTARLAEIVQPHNAHLSRNALKARVDGKEERFITQRCALIGRAEAHARLNALLAVIAPIGYAILDVEEEFVVYDSNVDLDAGWLSPRSN